MNAVAALVLGDRIYHSPLAQGEAVSFGSGKRDDVPVPDFIPSQIILKLNSGGVAVNSQKVYGVKSLEIPFDTLVKLGDDALLYIGSDASQSDKTLALPYNGVFRVGRAEDRDITVNLPFVSSKHLTFWVEARNVRVEDNGSTNGTFVNGKRITAARLKSGDVVSILTVRIQLLNGVLQFYGTADRLEIHPRRDQTPSRSGQVTRRGSRILYRRSPRTQDVLPSEDIVLAPAPSKGQRYTSGRGMLASVASSGAMVAASMLSTAMSPALLAARAASMISPIAGMASSRSSAAQGKKKSEQYERLRREKYGAYIADQKALIESVAETQRSILTGENPSPGECGDILFNLDRDLWERSPLDRDFLSVRVGMGYEDLCVKVNSRADGGGFQMEDDEIREMSSEIIEETRIVDNVPTRLNLRELGTVGFIGGRGKTMALVRNLIIELTTFHCPDDVRLVGIFGGGERAYWEPLKWFPHITEENGEGRLLAFGREEAHTLCEKMNEILRARRGSAGDGIRSARPAPSPHYVFIIGNAELTDKEPVLEAVLRGGPDMGASALFLFGEIYLLPNECRYIVDVDGGPVAYEKNEANRRIYFTADPVTDDNRFDLFARRMSAIELTGSAREAKLPDGITFLEGYGVKAVEELCVESRWARSNPVGSLAAAIGVKPGGKPVYLDIHEDVHGPHGLVAGSTGSGKSELLLSYILSMCLNYRPDEVNFVLIDYKGGSMATLMADLPHVTGIISNLGAGVERALRSLSSEIKRREKIFGECGLPGKKNIYRYQEAYREGRVGTPVPHLIIMTDEFAELKKERPDFISGLVSVARLGREFGVHLILATQTPGGVVDNNILSNSRFRVCLKMQTPADSREIIGRDSAASITRPGRAFLRVGQDEYFGELQSYWSGAPYYGAGGAPESDSLAVRVVKTDGTRVKTGGSSKRAKAPCDELTAIVKYIADTAKRLGVTPPRGPWLPELPGKISLQALGVPGGFDGHNWPRKQPWLAVPIGKYDIPEEQSQGVQYIDLADGGHCGIYGAPGTGKTSLLKEIVFALGCYFSPDDVNIYILDCGGWSMSVFSEMPHVGSVALDQEEEKFAKFAALITDEIDRRRQLFLAHTVSTISAYRETVSGDLPAIVIAIDNFVALLELYPDLESFFITVAGTGPNYGIFLIYTANSTTGVRYKVLQNVRGAVAFELTDKADYAALVGRPDSGLPNIRGRAYSKGSPPVQFQAALCCEGSNEKEITQRLKAELAKMNAAWSGRRPPPIPVMPRELPSGRLAGDFAAWDKLPVGLLYENIATAYLDLREHYCALITGDAGAGKSETLRRLVALVKEKFPETRAYVFDGSDAPLRGLKDTVSRYTGARDGGAVAEALDEIIAELNSRATARKTAGETGGAVFGEGETAPPYGPVLVVIDNLKEFVDEVADKDKTSMERVCRLAEGLGVEVLAAGRTADIEKYNEIESLTRVIVGHGNGVALGGSPSRYPFFKNTLSYTEKTEEAGEGNGWLFAGGRCRKIRLPDKEERRAPGREASP